jgi:hypothetical protein
MDENQWLIEFEENLRNGSIVHIGYTSDGRPIYRAT